MEKWLPGNYPKLDLVNVDVHRKCEPPRGKTMKA